MGPHLSPTVPHPTGISNEHSRRDTEPSLPDGDEARVVDNLGMARLWRHPKLQGVWAKQAGQCRRTRLLATLGEDDAADFRSYGGVGAGSFLHPGHWMKTMLGWAKSQNFLNDSHGLGSSLFSEFDFLNFAQFRNISQK